MSNFQQKPVAASL